MIMFFFKVEKGAKGKKQVFFLLQKNNIVCALFSF